MNSSDSCQFLFNFHVAFVTLCLWGSPWVAWRLPTVKVALDKKKSQNNLHSFLVKEQMTRKFFHKFRGRGTVFGWGGQWALSLVGVTKSQDNLYSFQMHGYDYGGRPPLPPPPPPNDLVSPPGYPPIQPSGEQPPFPSVHHSPSMDGYTLTSLDTSNESWGHYEPQSLLWYIHV